jgi:hypothetical protein
LARTEAELRELGAKVVEAEAKYIRQNVAAAKGVAAVVKNPRSKEAQAFIQDTKKQTVAALHGAGDAATLGLADKGSAAVRATLQSGGDLSRWKSNYHADMDQERAQDAYDEANYADARHGGEIVGTVGSLLIPGGAVAKVGGGALRIAAPLARTAVEAIPALGKYGVPAMERMVEATPAILRERIAAGAASGTAGAATQTVSDALEGRQSTGGDLSAAAIGGFVQGFGGHAFGHFGTGAVGGAVTSGLGDVLNGRPVSLEDMVVGGGVGALAGGYAGIKGAQWADGLPTLKNSAPMTKGDLGEALSIWRSVLRGSPVTSTRERRINLPGSPGAKQDHAIGSALPVEAKFGPDAGLRRGQRVVYQQGRYGRVDHHGAQDVATIVSIPTSQLASDSVRGLLNADEDGRNPDWDWQSLLSPPEIWVRR